jgi:Tfp pilus assembly protein PilF
MSKMPGRKDPCPCGSGKQYKQCCRERDRAAQSVADRARATQERQRQDAAREEAQDLDTASTAIVGLIDAGRLDEAEQAAQRLLQDYPEVPDGHWRLAMVYEARGDRARAAESYRAVLQIIQAQPAGSFDPKYEQFLCKKVAELS